MNQDCHISSKSRRDRILLQLCSCNIDSCNVPPVSETCVGRVLAFLETKRAVISCVDVCELVNIKTNCLRGYLRKFSLSMEIGLFTILL